MTRRVRKPRSRGSLVLVDQPAEKVVNADGSRRARVVVGVGVGFVNSAVPDLQANRAGGRKAWLAIGPGRRTVDGRSTLSLIVSSRRRGPPNGFTGAKSCTSTPPRTQQRRDGRALAVIGPSRGAEKSPAKVHAPAWNRPPLSEPCNRGRNRRDRRFTIPLQIGTAEFTNPAREAGGRRASADRRLVTFRTCCRLGALCWLGARPR
jgi:hypothetical protein